MVRSLTRRSPKTAFWCPLFRTYQWEPEVCGRENNGLLSELGRKYLLGSGLGKRHKVRHVTGEAGAVVHLERLSYAQSLRAIGESLERQGISTFDLEKRGKNYSLRVI